MRIVSINPRPIEEVVYLNAGRSRSSFYEARIPVLTGVVEGLPAGLKGLLLTADLQGRERFEEARGGPPRLLGAVLPERLESTILPRCGLPAAHELGVILAGDFYTVPALDRRGGTGDVSSVWQAFGRSFAWVAGVAGNHDAFGERSESTPRFSRKLHYLDGERTTIEGLRIAGLGGIIGNPEKFRRRAEDDYLQQLESLLEVETDLLILHDGPDAATGNSGSPRVRALLSRLQPPLVVRGHCHWEAPFVEGDDGMQVVNCHEQIIVLVAAPLGTQA